MNSVIVVLCQVVLLPHLAVARRHPRSPHRRRLMPPLPPMSPRPSPTNDLLSFFFLLSSDGYPWPLQRLQPSGSLPRWTGVVMPRPEASYHIELEVRFLVQRDQADLGRRWAGCRTLPMTPAPIRLLVHPSFPLSSALRCSASTPVSCHVPATDYPVSHHHSLLSLPTTLSLWPVASRLAGIASSNDYSLPCQWWPIATITIFLSAALSPGSLSLFRSLSLPTHSLSLSSYSLSLFLSPVLSLCLHFLLVLSSLCIGSSIEAH